MRRDFADRPEWRPGLRYLPVPEGAAMWVFGYGSLMWRPDFPHSETRRALLYGYHRAFCIHSHHYRGTPERPGLVLGLDRGGSCRGLAFKVDPDDVIRVLDTLWQREMVTGVYRPSLLALAQTGAERVRAVGFVADRSHRQYCPPLPKPETVARIRQGTGVSGPNRDYLANTVAHLETLGIHDDTLRHLLQAVDDRA